MTLDDPEFADFHYVQHLPSPDNEHIFALFIDTSPFGDTGWFVFKFDKDFDVKNFEIPWANYVDGSYRKDVIMSNYAEGGDHGKNPNIEIVDNSYLVFMRGGLYHSLYSLEKNAILVGFESPWHEWRDSEEYASIQPNPSDEEESNSIDEWKRRNLHIPILKIIQSE
ncbi:MAG: hypothetical protein GY805_27215 [Chloroflexi bacterium]|nr:hypothetical protein [Chloroflexota bacterium]